MADNEKEPKTMKTPVDSGVIMMTRSELSEVVAAATKAAVAVMGNSEKATPKRTVDLATTLTSTLTTRINSRIKKGNLFFSALANSTRRARISIPSLFRPHTGKELTVTLNGSTIKIPVDGQTYEVHPAYVPIINEKLRFISEMQARNAQQNDLFGDEAGDFAKVNK